jgi:hypothetical protein
MWTFDMVKNWSVTRAISALTLRQYENALSQIKKGIGVSVGSLLLRELAAKSARWLGLSRRKLLPFSPNARPLRAGARPQVH